MEEAQLPKKRKKAYLSRRNQFTVPAATRHYRRSGFKCTEPSQNDGPFQDGMSSQHDRPPQDHSESIGPESAQQSWAACEVHVFS